MDGYLGLFGGLALGLAVIALFIATFFAGKRTRDLIKMVRKPARK